MSINGIQPPLGIVPETWDCTVRVRAGNVSMGHLYAFCLLSSAQITSDGVTLSTDPNDPGFPYASIAAPSTNDRRCGRFCIALADANDGELVRVRVRGLVNAVVQDTANATINIGEELIATGTNLDAATVTGGSTLRKILGYPLQSSSGTTSDGVTLLVDFDGWSGVGSANAT